jgi:hypothetical protein
MAFPLFPPVAKGTGDIISDIANEIDPDSDRDDMRNLFRLFSTSLTLNEDGKVQLSELMNEILRTSKWFISDEDIKEILGCEELSSDCVDKEKYVTFSEFVMLYRKNLMLGQK